MASVNVAGVAGVMSVTFHSGTGSSNSSSLALLTQCGPHLVDVETNCQIFALAVPASGLFRPLLDADQHFIFWLLDIKDVLQVWPRKRDTAVRAC